MPENEKEVKEYSHEAPKVWTVFQRIIYVEAITVIVVIISVFFIKMFFADTFYELKDWYSKYILTETTVSGVTEIDEEKEMAYEV